MTSKVLHAIHWHGAAWHCSTCPLRTPLRDVADAARQAICPGWTVCMRS